MSSLQRQVARSQSKGDMIKAVAELRQTAQMWKSLYDEQTVNMSKMGEDFGAQFQQAMEEIAMTKAVTYMMLWNSENNTIEVLPEQIESFNKKSEEDGNWDIDIGGDDEAGFDISLLWKAEDEVAETDLSEMPFLDNPDEEERRIDEEAALDAAQAEDDGFQGEAADEG